MKTMYRLSASVVCLVIMITSAIWLFTMETAEFSEEVTETERLLPHTISNWSSGYIGDGSKRQVEAKEAAQRNNEDEANEDVRELKRRFPQCLVIGFAKCGTRAMLNYLGLHPRVKSAGREIHFYDNKENFDRGYKWYLQQMPLSYSDQMTVEKTPAYVLSTRAREEISRNFPDMKLVVLVRDPVERLLSAYAQMKAKLINKNKTVISLDLSYRDAKSGAILSDREPVNSGIYIRHLKPWMATFKREQILVVDGEKLVTEPTAVVKEVEKFLKLPPMFSERNFMKNKTTGFFCYKGFDQQVDMKCLDPSKGRQHEILTTSDRKKLNDFYRPYNKKLFSLIQRTFQWA